MNENNIEKKHLYNGLLNEIKDYGIYNYFKYNDNVHRSKLIAAIFDNQYVITTYHSDKSDHLVMHYDIQETIGKYNCFLGSSGNELNVFVSNTLTYNQISMLISIFNELKAYFLDTNINKKVSFIGYSIENKFDKFKNCLDIDEILELLNQMLKEKEPNYNISPWNIAWNENNDNVEEDSNFNNSQKI